MIMGIVNSNVFFFLSSGQFLYISPPHFVSLHNAPLPQKNVSFYNLQWSKSFKIQLRLKLSKKFLGFIWTLTCYSFDNCIQIWVWFCLCSCMSSYIFKTSLRNRIFLFMGHCHMHCYLSHISDPHLLNASSTFQSL